jgi:hypothetical protein
MADPEYAAVRAEAVRIAKNIVAGSKDVLLGLRELVPLLERMGITDADEDFANLFAVESEIEDLPLGHERRVWPREMWSEIDSEIANTKRLYRQPLLAECRRLIQRLAEERKLEG